MNRITCTGRLAKDGEIRYSSNQTAILNMTIASDVGFGDNKTTNWFNAAVMGKRAEAIQSFALKGKEVTVFGTLTLRKYKNRDGIEQISPDIFVDDIQFHGGKGSGKQEPSQAADDSDSSIPF
jgi:single-strand DNA-binding protein